MAKAAKATASPESTDHSEDLDTGTGQLAKLKSKTAAQLKKTVSSGDPIEDAIFKIENLNSEAKALAEVSKFSNQQGISAFTLGGVLSKMQEKSWFGNYESFRKMVEGSPDIPVGYRQANYLIQIYRSLVNAEVKWEQVGHLGWTKVRCLTKVLTKENVDYWVGLAAHPKTVTQLEEDVKAYLKGTTPKKDKADGAGDDDAADEGPVEAAQYSTITFKVHADQKELIRDCLDQVKEEAETKYDAVALERLCQAYMGGAMKQIGKDDKKQVVALLASLGIDETLECLEAAFPNLDLKVGGAD